MAVRLGEDSIHFAGTLSTHFSLARLGPESLSGMKDQRVQNPARRRLTYPAFCARSRGSSARQSQCKSSYPYLISSSGESVKEMTLASPRLLVSLSISVLSLLSGPTFRNAQKNRMETQHHHNPLNRLVNSNI